MAKRMSTDQRRAQLLAAGRQLFADRAYDQISTDEISAATNTSKGLLYHYFGSKRGFYLATIRAAAEDLLAVTEFDDLQAGALASIDGFVGFVEREGQLFRAVVRGGIGSDAEVDGLVTGVRQEIVGRIVRATDVASDDPVLVGRVWGWLGYTESLAIHWIDTRPFPRDTLRDLLLSGLATLVLTQAS